MAQWKLDDIARDFCPMGKHLVRLDGDILCICVRGAVELSEMVCITVLARELYERHGYALILCDATDAKSPTMETRRYQHEQHKAQVFPSHSAVYGASTLVRSIVVLAQRATELVTGKQTPASFHKTEAEARAQLALQRSRLSPKRPP
jgi:hypothetical protein